MAHTESCLQCKVNARQYGIVKLHTIKRDFLQAYPKLPQSKHSMNIEFNNAM
jgi:hypothetical protein